MTTKRAAAKANDNADLRKMFKNLEPKKTDDWQGWKDRIWESMHRGLNPTPLLLPPDYVIPTPAPGFGNAGMACLEQYMHRSKGERRCIECGDPGTVEQQSRLIAVVDVYWMCADCDAWWKHKACTKRSHKTCGRGTQSPAIAAAGPAVQQRGMFEL